MPELRERGMAAKAPPLVSLPCEQPPNTEAVHLFGGCNIRDSRPGRGAACPVGPDRAFALQLPQDERVVWSLTPGTAILSRFRPTLFHRDCLR
jgi:hypothetical protein